MKNYSELSDFEINCLVAGSLGNISVSRPKDELSGSSVSYFVHASNGINRLGEIVMCEMEVKKDFCNNPSDAWPIIVEEKISIMFDSTLPEYEGEYHEWCSAISSCQKYGIQYQSNPLRAAMIVYLMMRESE